MLFPRLLVAMLCCFSTSTLVSSSPSSIPEQRLPDKWFHMNLDSAEATGDNSLVPRTPVKSCLNALHITSSCITVGSFVVSTCQGIAAQIRSLADQHSCATMNGVSQGLRYSYYSTGRHCDTTAQQDTIAGSIKKFLTDVEHGKVCGTICLRLDHGGTWNGWLKLGPEKAFNAAAYCGPGLPFNKCISGGNNDI